MLVERSNRSNALHLLFESARGCRASGGSEMAWVVNGGVEVRVGNVNSGRWGCHEDRGREPKVRNCERKNKKREEGELGISALFYAKALELPCASALARA